MKKRMYNTSSTIPHVLISSRERMRCLEELASMLTDFYIPYNKEVAQPYSEQEQTILVGIIEKILCQLPDIPPYALYCRKHLCSGNLGLSYLCVGFENRAEIGEHIHFRLTLDSETPFSIQGRMHCLQQLDGTFQQFFSLGSPVVNKRPYSHHEQLLFTKILKFFVHQLWGTPYYRLFITKRRPKRKTSSEELELRNQQRDEARLRFTRITLYNPLSEKYKAEKEKVLQKIKNNEIVFVAFGTKMIEIRSEQVNVYVFELSSVCRLFISILLTPEGRIDSMRNTFKNNLVHTS